MKKTLSSLVKGGVAGVALAGLAACSNTLSQREVTFDASMASQYSNASAYELGTNSVVLDRVDNVPYKDGNSISLNPSLYIGKKAIIHYDGNNDFGVSVQIEDVAPDETYRVSCPAEKDDKTKVVKSWGPCSEYIETPSQGGDGSSGGGSGGGSDGGGSGGGDSGGGGSGSGGA